MSWKNASHIESRAYDCGYCSNRVASAIGFTSNSIGGTAVHICPHCDCPTYLTPGRQVPGALPGNAVESVPAEVHALYDEARSCTSVNAHTAAVLSCRKLLMHIAVAQGAGHNLKFIQYVEYLSSQGYVPPNGKSWVDHIRKKGNDANHELVLMSQADAQELLLFVEMLLRFVYEFPSRVPT